MQETDQEEETEQKFAEDFKAANFEFFESGVEKPKHRNSLHPNEKPIFDYHPETRKRGHSDAVMDYEPVFGNDALPEMPPVQDHFHFQPQMDFDVDPFERPKLDEPH